MEDSSLLSELMKHPPKIRRKTFWRTVASKKKNIKLLAGIFVFSSLCKGPPGRAHGGSVATAFDDAQGALVVRERGFMPSHNTIELIIEYKGATPLKENMVMVARMVDFDDRECSTEAILLPATIFFQLKNPFEDIWVKKIKISARSTAKWKRPKASSVGLDKILDYDEAYELFKNASPDEFQKQSTTGKQWGEKKEEKMVRKKSEGSKL